MLNFSPEKLFLVGLIALMVLGPNRLPQAARTLGRFMSELRRMSASFQDEVRGAIGEPTEAFHSAIADFRPMLDLQPLDARRHHHHPRAAGLQRSRASRRAAADSRHASIPLAMPGPLVAPDDPVPQLRGAAVAVTDRPVGPSPDPGEDAAGQMTLFEHLAELRTRLLICIIAVIVTTVVAWFFYGHVVHFVTEPYRDYLRHHESKNI